jgi:large subunit ribosomal protein L15
MASLSPSTYLSSLPRLCARRSQCSKLAKATYATRFSPREGGGRRIFHAERDQEQYSRPRWAQTPQAMKAPLRTQPNPKPLYRCNEDPVELDAAYVRVLGEDGDQMLQDEVKWLAVTHKSFDQGRRGFNDRLSYLGTFRKVGAGG